MMRSPSEPTSDRRGKSKPVELKLGVTDGERNVVERPILNRPGFSGDLIM
jgi:hypothetical protein